MKKPSMGQGHALYSFTLIKPEQWYEKGVSAGDASGIIAACVAAKKGETSWDIPLQLVRKHFPDYVWPERLQIKNAASAVDPVDADPVDVDADPVDVPAVDIDTQDKELIDRLRGVLSQDAIDALERMAERAAAPKTMPVPDPKTADYVKPECWAEVLMLCQAKENVLLVGPAGCGKTRMAAEIASALGLGYFAMSVAGGVRYSQVVGATRINADGSTNWQPSELLQAIQQPNVILLDEIDTMDPDISAVFSGILEKHTRSINTPIGLIKVHENAVFIGAANTDGRTRDPRYMAGQKQDGKVLDRFFLYRVGYDANVEGKLLSSIGVKGEPRRYLINALDKLRKGIEVNSIAFDASTRRLIAAGRAIQAGFEPERAFQIAFVNSLSDTERAVLGV